MKKLRHKFDVELMPRLNVYICEYGCHTVTVDVDDGVTPMFIRCHSRSTPDRPIAPHLLDKNGYCIGQARSCFYPRGPHIKAPEWEWYKPDPNTITIETLKQDGVYYDEDVLAASVAATKAHVLKGGLIMRPRTNAEPVYHEPHTPLSEEEI